MSLNIFDEFQSTDIVILIGAQNFLFEVSGELFMFASESINMTLVVSFVMYKYIPVLVCIFPSDLKSVVFSAKVPIFLIIDSILGPKSGC